MSFDNSFKEFLYYLKHHKISIDVNEFKFQAQAHPNYPSLLALSDTLTFFNIPNLATRVYKDEIEDLPDSFLALLEKEDQKTSFFFLNRTNKLYQYTQGKEKKEISLEKVKEIWKDVVLLIEKPDDFDEQTTKAAMPQFLKMLGLMIFALVLIYWFSNSFIALCFGFFSIIGLIFSFEALKTELGINSKVSEAFCGIISNADCKQVINSKKVSWLNRFKISDISIWFFSSQILSLFLFSIAIVSNFYFGYIFILLIISLPITAYSLYFQYKIEKKWCPLCLSIIGIIYLQIILLLFNKNSLNFSLDIKLLSLLTFTFILTGILLYFLKPILTERKEIKEKYLKQLRFSRNYESFKNNLVTSQPEYFKSDLILLGNRAANKKITVITSPFCGFCESVHKVLENILEKYYDKISISIRLNFYEDAMDIDTKNLILRMVEIYYNDGDWNFMAAMNDWFKQSNYEKWFLKYGTPQNINMIKTHLNETTIDNLEKGLSFTPNIFLNQYNYPKHYNRDNLEFFISEWLEEDEEENI